MTKRLFIILILMRVGFAHAQQGPSFSHFMFNKAYWNPAHTAEDAESSIMLISRNQWTGYETSFENDNGAPRTQFMRGSTPITLSNINLGVGLVALYDVLGPVSSTELNGLVALHKDLPRAQISLGLKLKGEMRSLDPKQLVAVDPSEIENFNSTITETKFDLGAGLAYRGNDFEFSFAVSNLLRPEYDYLSNESSELIEYNFLGSYTYRFSSKIELEPTLLLRSDFVGFTFDLGVRACYENKMWAAISYRDREATSLLLGYSFLKARSLDVGYGFDITIKDRKAKQATSHELYLQYRFRQVESRSKKIIRTPRFRF